jgi:hypothetical protein
MADFSDYYTEEVDSPSIDPGKDESGKPKWNFHWHGEEPIEDSRPQLVQDLIPEVGVGLIAGQWGTYKTFAALDLASAVMGGGDFVKFPVLRKGGVLFLACEGQSEVSIRLEGVLKDKCTGIEKAPFAWLEHCPRLLDKTAGAELADMIRAAGEEMQCRFGMPLVLVVIDTYGRAAAYDRTGQENDTAANKIIMRHLADAARGAQVFIMAIDHFGKAVETGTRGSSSKEDDADVVLALLGEKNIDGSVENTRMAIRKRRNGANGEMYPFTPRVVSLEDGFTILSSQTTLVIDWNTSGEDERPTSQKKTKKDGWTAKSLRLLRQVMMNMIADCGFDERPFPNGPTVRVVDIELVRTEFYKSYPAAGDDKEKKESRRRAFNRSLTEARDKGLLGSRDIGAVTYVWLTTPNETHQNAHTGNKDE